MNLHTLAMLADRWLDPHGATGNGNPIGGLAFPSAFGQLEQTHERQINFVSESPFHVWRPWKHRKFFRCATE
ncbi:hypothetical protein F5887DRAFT_1016356 [Amanita rubescens]|nr:hypothetical protein F5887DRAFT_1016356 [Amanita rubescens]